MEESVDIDHVYKGIRVIINGCEMKIDLIPLELHEFDVILCMDLLGIYRAQINIVKLIMPHQLCLNDRRVIFREEKKHHTKLYYFGYDF